MIKRHAWCILHLGTPGQSRNVSLAFFDVLSLAPGAMEWQPYLLQLLEEKFPALQYTGQPTLTLLALQTRTLVCWRFPRMYIGVI